MILTGPIIALPILGHIVRANNGHLTGLYWSSPLKFCTLELRKEGEFFLYGKAEKYELAYFSA